MKNIQKQIRTLGLLGLFVLPFGLLVSTVSSPVFATNKCGGVDTAILSCSQNDPNAKDVDQTGFWGILILAINILSVGVGIAAVGGIVWGSVLYASAGGSPEQVKKAKTIITDVAIGLLLYAAMYAFLNFITPGGLFA